LKEDKVRRALISVSDKRDLEPLLKTLERYSVYVLASKGTAQRIRELGYRVEEIADYTGWPEMPGGLLKTLHPKIFAGILGDLSDRRHRDYMERLGIDPIDLVVVNLYPFEKAVAKGDTSLEEGMRNIDVGGVALIRSAAKATLLYGRVAVVVDPGSYPSIIHELESNGGAISLEVKRRWAVEAFKRTAQYEAEVSKYLQREVLEEGDG
jgi:phosphoribosylaminoimidazolecarboxamide formyltransferase/IMP cyclohydrolase